MTLGIVTALWGRQRLTRIFGRYYDALHMDGIDFIKVAVYSEAPDAAALSDAWETVYAPNDPRSDKWNVASKHLEDRCDAILVVGSDDFVHPSHIAEGLKIIRQPRLDLVHPKECWFFDTATRRLGWGLFSRVGAGRLISAELADSLDWQLWEPNQIRNIDRSMGLRMRGVTPEIHPSPLVLDIKVDEERGRNIWSYDFLRDTVKDSRRKRWEDSADPQGWLARHFPTIANDLMAYHDGWL